MGDAVLACFEAMWLGVVVPEHQRLLWLLLYDGELVDVSVDGLAIRHGECTTLLLKISSLRW